MIPSEFNVYGVEAIRDSPPRPNLSVRFAGSKSKGMKQGRLNLRNARRLDCS